MEGLGAAVDEVAGAGAGANADADAGAVAGAGGDSCTSAVAGEDVGAVSVTCAGSGTVAGAGTGAGATVGVRADTDASECVVTSTPSYLLPVSGILSELIRSFKLLVLIYFIVDTLTCRSTIRMQFLFPIQKSARMKMNELSQKTTAYMKLR